MGKVIPAISLFIALLYKKKHEQVEVTTFLILFNTSLTSHVLPMCTLSKGRVQKTFAIKRRNPTPSIFSTLFSFAIESWSQSKILLLSPLIIGSQIGTRDLPPP